MLTAAGVGAGDEVVVPAFGNVEVADAVAQGRGATVVFADIDPGDVLPRPRCGEEAVITPRTAALRCRAPLRADRRHGPRLRELGQAA